MTSFEYEGKDYTLHMTRAGIRAAEANGLRASEMADTPFSALDNLFFASLYSAYRVTPKKATAMLDHLLDTGETTVEKLFEELAEAYTELFGSGGSVG